MEVKSTTCAKGIRDEVTMEGEMQIVGRGRHWTTVMTQLITVAASGNEAPILLAFGCRTEKHTPLLLPYPARAVGTHSSLSSGARFP